MTTTLVTGINGFTGRYMAKRLRDAGHAVHGLAREPDRAGCCEIGTLHACDLLDLDRLTAVMEEVRPDYILHLAGIAFIAHGDLEEMYRSNILGTRALLEASANASVPPRAVLVASSANVYGNASEGTLTESAPVHPANDYAITKVAVENLAAIYAPRLPVILARPFNYTGVGQSVDFLIPKIVSYIRKRAPLIELGNLDVARDFSDVRAVTHAYLRLLETPSAIGDVFNVCSGRAVSLRDVVALACKIAGHEIEVTVNPAFVRANEVKLLKGSRDKLERTIGPLSMPPLEETLQWMIEG
ncbi:NAD-dependent epimerase/dehydratase family protein [Sphingomonas glacialis]|uniref:NAD-dependent epimerase/dehydratase family protein n=1 Tax=Sphingomonas glacialis TaxID=658225 RepID=A0A502FQ14_9SPHN|nr:NAD-dependent epimerase/dehydratase family protein [Sphingomonas glacialis]TPG51637.1 NAD-dependent epimerase/dehydratase family protein [Sphingomonas glacialis]